ncbi:MAG TPA: hypothetical protein PLV52_04815, partial [Candidatus Omnitrophota bacterium]|nr:hypothetical protein [Candidatus Omnitrophota bacterium]
MKSTRPLVCVILSALVIFNWLFSARLLCEETPSPYDAIEQLIDEADYKKAEDLLHDRLITNEKDVVALSMLG